ncbi:MAG: ubiquinone biosynthesis regulatory protein kinase UbiB [Gammaproteobacteria bacterium]|nr:ubiquinone biosynthesis regulatory protein kinase UbiB [Gammaproteobacteria bacterium]MCW5582653.1 ubiquinone biosynthesis regulatory protein kinase UbiB [Gammaproteobacteria bacterium]
MKIFTRLFRLIRINFILMRYNIDEIILGTHWFYPLRFFIYFNPYYWTLRNKLSRAERVRLAIEELGPIFVKAGQIISTRRDLLPDDIAIELSKLQDRVPPFPGQTAKRIIEEALNCSVHEIFSTFDTEALASASIAQVHAATLLSGDSVVVKVLRPHIRKMIDRDIDLFMALAKLAERYWYNARHFKPQQLVSEVAQTLYDELDLMREGANATQLRRNFSRSPLLYIPKIHWEYCRSNILVIERIHGIPIHDIEKLKHARVNMKKLAERGIEIFFTQVFRDSFFHADLHPGNIFVSAIDPENPTYIAVDFGIVGSLNHNDQRYLAENMIAFFKRDYQRVAELHIACGWLPPDTRIDQFEGAIRSVSEPIFEQPLHDISFGQLLMRLFQVAHRFHINIQPQLILLQKSLLSIEGLSRQLAPEFDLWASASPQIEKWLKKQVGARAFIRRLRDNLPLLSDQLPDVPILIYEILKETKQQQEKLRFAQATETTNGKEIKNREKKIKIEYFTAGVGLTMLMVLLMVFWVL